MDAIANIFVVTDAYIRNRRFNGVAAK